VLQFERFMLGQRDVCAMCILISHLSVRNQTRTAHSH